MKFYSTMLEEQETHIWVDYFDRKLVIYTSRQPVYNRLMKKLGEPKKIDTIKGEIASGTWEIDIEDKKVISSVLNRTILIGKYSK